jgi:hypothetical protein
MSRSAASSSQCSATTLHPLPEYSLRRGRADRCLRRGSLLQGRRRETLLSEIRLHPVAGRSVPSLPADGDGARDVRTGGESVGCVERGGRGGAGVELHRRRNDVRSAAASRNAPGPGDHTACAGPNRPHRVRAAQWCVARTGGGWVVIPARDRWNPPCAGSAAGPLHAPYAKSSPWRCAGSLAPHPAG